MLYLLVEGLLRIVELQEQVILLQAGGAHAVAGGQAVEERDAQIQADIAVEVVLHLVAKSQGRTSAHGVIARPQPAAERELGIESTLGDTDALVAAFQTIFRRLDFGTESEGLDIDGIGRRERGEVGLSGRNFECKTFG